MYFKKINAGIVFLMFCNILHDLYLKVNLSKLETDKSILIIIISELVTV